MQQEISSVLHALTISDREAVEKYEWNPAPIQSAAANEVMALVPRLREHQAYLLKIKKNKKLTSKEKAEDITNRLVTIEITKKRLEKAIARGKPAMTFQIQNGEAFAGPDTPPESFYELAATSNIPAVTAIKVEVPPIDSEKARTDPENGFIVEEVRASVLYPDGHKKRIPFRSFLHDSEANLEDAVTPVLAAGKTVKKKPGADGFAANPKLFHPRWPLFPL